MELLPAIRPIIEFLKPKRILDYGCGKGNLVKALANKYPSIKVYGYDPAVEEFEKMPVDKVDLVICTDVLEHIPENELPDTVARIASLSENVFFHLHHAKAVAVLPNGENAHCTIYSPKQYADLLKKFFPTLNFLTGLNNVTSTCITFTLPQNISDNWEFLIHPNAIKYADNLDVLIRLINSREEVIVFPVGEEGERFLELLKYFGTLNKISCIADIEVENGFKQGFIHGVPVIPFENLLHFRETALLIVAMPEKSLNSNFHAALIQFGFQFIVFIKNELHNQIIKELQKFYDTGQMLNWYVKRLDKKIGEMECIIYEQNEIRTINTQTFAEYRNAFRGKKVVIVGTGPTVDYYEPVSDAIHIGLNSAYLKDNIKLDYLFVQDAHDRQAVRRFKDSGFAKVKKKVFMGKYLNRTDYNWICFPEDYALTEAKIVRYLVKGSSWDLNPGEQQIFQDICHYPLVGFFSVVFSAFQFALFTYPAEIYLVGCDTTKTGHFYDQDEVKAGLVKPYLATGFAKVGYARMKMFARQYYPETKIISVNPVGLRGLFKDIYTERYTLNLT